MKYDAFDSQPYGSLYIFRTIVVKDGVFWANRITRKKKPVDSFVRLDAFDLIGKDPSVKSIKEFQLILGSLVKLLRIIG